MPKLGEAATLVVGQIIAVEAVPKYDEKGARIQGATDGVRVVLSTGEGFASVKLTDDRAAAFGVREGFGSWVAWLVRYGANSGRDGAAASYSAFVRPAEQSDVDRLANVLGMSGKKAA